MITIEKYVRAQSLEEAWQLNQNKRNRILGGMFWLRLGKGSVNTAIDLCDLGTLNFQCQHLQEPKSSQRSLTISFHRQR